jgi:hypothetical protein
VNVVRRRSPGLGVDHLVVVVVNSKLLRHVDDLSAR